MFIKTARKRDGFALILGVLAMGVSLLLITGTYLWIGADSNRIYEADRRDQASLLAMSGTRMMLAYMRTAQNHDRVNGWKTVVAPLSGEYQVLYSKDSGYHIAPGGNEVIKLAPGEASYTRTTKIENKEGNSDVKIITSTVSPGSSQEPVSYQYIAYNLYGE